MAEDQINNGKFVVNKPVDSQTSITGGVRSTNKGKGRFDLVPLYPLARLAKLYEAGSLAYGDRNWEKGLPLSRYWDSALRHLTQFSLGLTDEDHLIHGLWNLWCFVHTKAMIDAGKLPKELDDFPVENQKALSSTIQELLKACSDIPAHICQLGSEHVAYPTEGAKYPG